MVTTLGSQEWSSPAPLEVVTGCGGGVGKTFSNSEGDRFVDFPVVSWMLGRGHEYFLPRCFYQIPIPDAVKSFHRVTLGSGGMYGHEFI